MTKEELNTQNDKLIELRKKFLETKSETDFHNLTSFEKEIGSKETTYDDVTFDTVSMEVPIDFLGNREKYTDRKKTIKINESEYILTENPKVLFNDDSCFYSIKQKTTKETNDINIQMSIPEFWYRMTMKLDFQETGTTVLKG